MSKQAEPSAADIRVHAFKLLSRREYAVGELRQKLLKRWHDQECVDSVIAELIADDSVSDARFAEAFVRTRVARFQGPRKIRAQLGQRQVSETEIDRALDTAGTDWKALAFQWFERAGGRDCSAEERAGYYRRLINRGFTHDQAMDVVNGRV